MTRVAKSLNLFVSLFIPYVWKKKRKLISLGLWIHKITTILSFNKCLPSFPSKTSTAFFWRIMLQFAQSQNISSWLEGIFSRVISAQLTGNSLWSVSKPRLPQKNLPTSRGPLMSRILKISLSQLTKCMMKPLTIPGADFGIHRSEHGTETEGKEEDIK